MEIDMEPEAVQKMLTEVIQQEQVTLAWWTYVVFGIVAVLSAYLGAYLKKKGENYATKEDFDALLDQVKKTNQATEEIKTTIARRSDFEKQVLLDQYKLVIDLQTKIMSVATNLNRVRSGVQIPDFIKDLDIVPLTHVFEQVAINRWLLKDRFHELLLQQAQLLLKIANEKNEESLKRLSMQFEEQVTNFSKAMDEVFMIAKITSGTRVESIRI
jgi:hypothetical protein